jgi:adenylylsulfate kinase-like enzyme
MPVLWLCGPAGVGKSTVSWQLFTELTRAGAHVGFADTDQLCMCYPAPSADPGRERLRAQNLGAMLVNYRAAGARGLIVNGVVDPVRGAYREVLSEAALTVCRLRADRDELARRFTERHGPGDDLQDALAGTLADADAMDASNFADAEVDTSGVPAAQVAALVRGSCPRWPGFVAGATKPRCDATSPDTEAAGRSRLGADAPGGHILLISGPTGVGKSTIGFALYLKYLRAGLTAGYIDLRQIGFVSAGRPADRSQHRLKARNLAAMWRSYHAAGARHLVATGRVESHAELSAYREALPAATITLCRLYAGRAELTRRVISRGDGGSWPEPGDPLRGQPGEFLADVADRAVAEGDVLDRSAAGTISSSTAEISALRIDTDGRSVAEAADLIAATTGFPAP